MPLADGLDEALVCLLRPRDEHEAGGVPVEPVDDSRPLGIAAGRAELEQPVRERLPLVEPDGMHDEASGLVDDEQMLVLEHDSEPELDRSEALRLGQLELELLAARQPVALRTLLPVDEHPTGGDEPLGERPVSRPPAARRGRCRGAARRPTQERESGDVPTAALDRSAATNERNRRPTPTTMKVSARLNAGQ